MPDRARLRPPDVLRIASLVLLAAANRAPATAADPPRGGRAEVLALGLDDADRRPFYHLTVGSQVFPLEWARCLEGPTDHRPFLEGLDRFGFLPDPDDPGGLPIGISQAKAKAAASDVLMLGITCGACHVGQLSYRGRAVRIDGAPNLIRFVEFGTALADAVRAAATDPAAFVAFQLRLVQQPEYRGRLEAARPEAARRLLGLAGSDEPTRRALAAAVRPLFGAEARWPPDLGARALPIPGETPAPDVAGPLAARIRPGLRALIDREDAAAQVSDVLVETVWILKGSATFTRILDTVRRVGDTVAGPGRVDDFRLASNLMKAGQAPPLPATSPTSIPHVWGTGQIKWLGWDANTDTTMQRNVATAVALGASINRQAQATSMVPAHIFQLEELASKIPPPRWPEEVFGRINRAKVRRGHKLFEAHCARCHPAPKTAPPGQFVDYDLYDVGTDPNRARNFQHDIGERPPAPPPRSNLPEGLAILLNLIYGWEQVSPADALKWTGGRTETWRATGHYAGRPLVAIWASPPYLHNGSVPTLYDLLRPAAQRPKTFPVGGREFDPVKVGYAGPADAPEAFRFDTARDGNHNSGHEGPDCTDFSEEERMALLEYLKDR
ncbi:MAG: cytochrome c [Planctomycetaceae bacterium]|nr:cytochrome c [Planctomycetaceae bacterium]MBV8381336.1 cytochrome c [Planctomycetaceae bacterium]